MTGERGDARPVSGHGWIATATGTVLLSLTFLMVVVGAVFFFGRGGFGWPEWGLPGVQILWALGFSAAGYPITRRHPANPVGWLLMVAGAAAGVNLLGIWLGTTVGPGGNPSDGGWPAMWLVNAWVVSVAALSSAVTLFPSGSPPSRRWLGHLVLMWFSGILVYLYAASTGIVSAPEWSNPIARVANIVLQLSLAAGLFSLLVRWRRSGPVQRQQLKWVAYGVSLVGGTVLIVELGISNLAPGLYLAGTAVASVVILAVPATMGLAMLRYRLYDIDLVINRTLVYGVLTVTLALVYVGAVVLLQAALRALTGEGSQVAVVASTLAIAALFNPLRRVIQSLIDRRFYRQNYDVARTLESYSAALRDETDLERLDAELLAVVRKTLRPEHASLWLREPGERNR